jgi:hypothetical protein
MLLFCLITSSDCCILLEDVFSFLFQKKEGTTVMVLKSVEEESGRHAFVPCGRARVLFWVWWWYGTIPYDHIGKLKCAGVHFLH